MLKHALKIFTLFTVLFFALSVKAETGVNADKNIVYKIKVNDGINTLDVACLFKDKATVRTDNGGFCVYQVSSSYGKVTSVFREDNGDKNTRISNAAYNNDADKAVITAFINATKSDYSEGIGDNINNFAKFLEKIGINKQPKADPVEIYDTNGFNYNKDKNFIEIKSDFVPFIIDSNKNEYPKRIRTLIKKHLDEGNNTEKDNGEKADINKIIDALLSDNIIKTNQNIKKELTDLKENNKENNKEKIEQLAAIIKNIKVQVKAKASENNNETEQWKKLFELITNTEEKLKLITTKDLGKHNETLVEYSEYLIALIILLAILLFILFIFLSRKSGKVIKKFSTFPTIEDINKEEDGKIGRGFEKLYSGVSDKVKKELAPQFAKIGKGDTMAYYSYFHTIIFYLIDEKKIAENEIEEILGCKNNDHDCNIEEIIKKARYDRPKEEKDYILITKIKEDMKGGNTMENIDVEKLLLQLKESIDEVKKDIAKIGKNQKSTAFVDDDGEKSLNKDVSDKAKEDDYKSLLVTAIKFLAKKTEGQAVNLKDYIDQKLSAYHLENIEGQKRTQELEISLSGIKEQLEEKNNHYERLLGKIEGIVNLDKIRDSEIDRRQTNIKDTLDEIKEKTDKMILLKGELKEKHTSILKDEIENNSEILKTAISGITNKLESIIKKFKKEVSNIRGREDDVDYTLSSLKADLSEEINTIESAIRYKNKEEKSSYELLNASLTSYQENYNFATKILKQDMSVFENKTNDVHRKIKQLLATELEELKTTYNTTSKSYLRDAGRIKDSLLDQFRSGVESLNTTKEYEIEKSVDGLKQKLDVLQRSIKPEELVEGLKSELINLKGAIQPVKDSYSRFITEQERQISVFIEQQQQQFAIFNEDFTDTRHNFIHSYTEDVKQLDNRLENEKQLARTERENFHLDVSDKISGRATTKQLTDATREIKRIIDVTRNNPNERDKHEHELFDYLKLEEACQGWLGIIADAKEYVKEQKIDPTDEQLLVWINTRVLSETKYSGLYPKVIRAHDFLHALYPDHKSFIELRNALKAWHGAVSSLMNAGDEKNKYSLQFKIASVRILQELKDATIDRDEAMAETVDVVFETEAMKELIAEKGLENIPNNMVVDIINYPLIDNNTGKMVEYPKVIVFGHYTRWV